MLRIPSATDVPPPLMAPVRLAVPDEALAEPEPKRTKKRRGGKKAITSDDHFWERAPSKGGSGRRETRQMRWMLIGGGLLFALSLGGVIVSLYTHPLVPSPQTKVTPAVVALKEIKASDRSDVSILSETQPLAKRFLEAKTVDELLPCVRNLGVVEKRIRSFYPQGEITAPGMAKFNTSGSVTQKDSFIAVSVRTADQEEKLLAFVETPQGLRVDWEAWVGWSDVRWDDFISTKSTKPSTFRLSLAKVDYYNFGYLDDAKWRSYRLESPDGEHSLYGYVERGSALDKQIQIDADTSTLPMMLSLRFAPDSKARDQVEITGVVAEGWVEK
jgi:hypothetical protein